MEHVEIGVALLSFFALVGAWFVVPGTTVRPVKQAVSAGPSEVAEAA